MPYLIQLSHAFSQHVGRWFGDNVEQLLLRGENKALFKAPWFRKGNMNKICMHILFMLVSPLSVNYKCQIYAVSSLVISDIRTVIKMGTADVHIK